MLEHSSCRLPIPIVVCPLMSELLRDLLAESCRQGITDPLLTVMVTQCNDLEQSACLHDGSNRALSVVSEMLFRRLQQEAVAHEVDIQEIKESPDKGPGY